MEKRRHSYLMFVKSIILFMLATCYSNVIFGQSNSSEEAPIPTFKFGGFLQQQFIADETDGVAEQFLIKRARVGVTGSLTDRIHVNLIGGFLEPPDRTPALVNAFIDFDIHPLFQVRTGQFLLPFGLEGPEPIFLNPAIERTMAIRRLNTFRMFRDIGIQIGGRSDFFNYKIALVNGQGANQAEQFDPKDVMGRMGVMPVENLELGVSAHFGSYHPNPNIDDHESRVRIGTDVSYKSNPILLRAEYIKGENDLPNGDTLKMNGWYVLGGYKFTNKLQSIVRYEYFNPNTSFDDFDNQYTAFTIGANYYFVGNTRVSVNYEIRDDKLNPDLENLLTIQMQITL